jgi:hypothetical protein
VPGPDPGQRRRPRTRPGPKETCLDQSRSGGDMSWAEPGLGGQPPTRPGPKEIRLDQTRAKGDMPGPGPTRRHAWTRPGAKEAPPDQTRAPGRHALTRAEATATCLGQSRAWGANPRLPPPAEPKARQMQDQEPEPRNTTHTKDQQASDPDPCSRGTHGMRAAPQPPPRTASKPQNYGEMFSRKSYIGKTICLSRPER